MFRLACAPLRPALGILGAAAALDAHRRRAPAARCLRVEEEVKLDYKDVLIRPKRSTLRSRSEVTLERPITFKHSRRTLSCVPLIVANMDTVGTFEMAEALAPHGCVVAVHKHYSIDEWAAFCARSPEAAAFVAVSAGVGAADTAKLDAILERCPAVLRVPREL